MGGRVGVVEVSAGSRRENSILPLSFLMLETCTFLHGNAMKRVRKPALPVWFLGQRNFIVGAVEPALETYIRSVREEIYHLLGRGPLHHSNDNTTNLERKALLSLRTKSDIIIKPTDKGAGTVVMSKDDYSKKVTDHLNNTLFYKKLGDDPMERFLEEITSVLAPMSKREMLDRDTFDFL